MKMFCFALFIGFLTVCGIHGSAVDSADIDDAVLLFENIQGLQGNFACTVCEDFMKIVSHFLETPTNQENIKKLMDEVCDYLPLFKGRCKELVKEYGTIVIDLAVSYLKPAICKTFHVCSGERVISERENCRMCKLAVGIVYDTVSDPDLKVRMEQVLHELCVDTINTDKLCSAISEEVTASVLPVAYSLRDSEFFKNVCTEAQVCKTFI
ncbi:hypothetical protein ACF0H5_001062 [Mactra antiquata]